MRFVLIVDCIFKFILENKLQKILKHKFYTKITKILYYPQTAFSNLFLRRTFTKKSFFQFVLKHEFYKKLLKNISQFRIFVESVFYTKITEKHFLSPIDVFSLEIQFTGKLIKIISCRPQGAFSLNINFTQKLKTLSVAHRSIFL